ncbi:MAG: hypothetical protein JW726_14990 [Anaerolineales bacterium]|nr:hypothetical protein [Anaerolineales bacterium]
MNKIIRPLFLVHAIVALVFGLPLLGMPGRFLDLFGWAPVDPIISRFLGAALLGLAWGSFRSFCQPGKMLIIIEVEAVFCTLASLALIWHMRGSHWPLMVWLILALFIILAVLWVLAWLNLRKSTQ